MNMSNKQMEHVISTREIEAYAVRLLEESCTRWGTYYFKTKSEAHQFVKQRNGFSTPGYSTTCTIKKITATVKEIETIVFHNLYYDRADLWDPFYKDDCV